jgi:hypothetical protein
MPDLADRALNAKRESKYVEFKERFDPSSAAEWCEVIKDIVAIANSGGGIIVFGLDNSGNPTGDPLDALSHLDPADIANKISRYAGSTQVELEVLQLEKVGVTLYAFVIQPAPIPIVFQKPGTYDTGTRGQKTAFSVGTVYFRHGAKSEPGTSDDLRAVVERQLEVIRHSWIKGVRKVVQAPAGSQIIAVRPGEKSGTTSFASTVRVVNDPSATPVLLTRAPDQSAIGNFVHEEISEGIFDEINNVIDANRVLARGQRHFFLGAPVYYRIYAERQHVNQNDAGMAVLLHSAVCDLYSPALFWASTLPPEIVAGALAKLYLHPTSPQIHSLVRMSVLLGREFYEWLLEKWNRKWKDYAQPPSFYWGFKQLKTKITDNDPRILAARASKKTIFRVSGKEEVGVSKLLDSPQLASSLVSAACIRVFQGEKDMRSMARDLDYFAYGPRLLELGPQIGRATMKVIGDREAGDLGEAAPEEV